MASIEMIMILGVSIMALCVISVVAAVIYSKSGGTATAGSTTNDVVAGLFSGTGAGILDIGKQIGAAFDADTQACKTKYGKDILPGDNLFADNKICYMCKNGHQKRSEFDITTDKACFGPPEILVPARKSQGILTESDKIEWDTGASLLFVCPDKTGRNTGPVWDPLPCQGTCSDLYGAESFQHVLSGECYSCPGGNKVTLSSPGKECQAKDGSFFAWVKNGLMNVPFKYKESYYESAVRLGDS